jgi:hypothetical protein
LLLTARLEGATRLSLCHRCHCSSPYCLESAR